MSVTALITGKLVSQPEQRTGSSGKPFTTARMLAGTEDENVPVSIIAFGPAAEQLAALGKGDTVALAGRMKPKVWLKDGEPMVALDMVVDGLLTAYHLRRKRAAMACDAGGEGVGAPDRRSGRHGSAVGRGGHSEQRDLPGAGDDGWLNGANP